MYRIWLIALSGALTALAAWQASFGHAAQAWVFAGWIGAVLLGLIFERTLYKADLAAAPGPDWVATAEREVDDTGVVRVWCHPRTGERAYVREKAGV